MKPKTEHIVLSVAGGVASLVIGYLVWRHEQSVSIAEAAQQQAANQADTQSDDQTLEQQLAQELETVPSEGASGYSVGESDSGVVSSGDSTDSDIASILAAFYPPPSTTSTTTTPPPSTTSTTTSAPTGGPAKRTTGGVSLSGAGVTTTPSVPTNGTTPLLGGYGTYPSPSVPAPVNNPTLMGTPAGSGTTASGGSIPITGTPAPVIGGPVRLGSTGAVLQRASTKAVAVPSAS